MLVTVLYVMYVWEFMFIVVVWRSWFSDQLSYECCVMSCCVAALLPYISRYIITFPYVHMIDHNMLHLLQLNVYIVITLSLKEMSVQAQTNNSTHSAVELGLTKDQ